MDTSTTSTPGTLTKEQRRERLRGQIRELNFQIEDLELKIDRLSEQQEALRRELDAVG